MESWGWGSQSRKKLFTGLKNPPRSKPLASQLLLILSSEEMCEFDISRSQSGATLQTWVRIKLQHEVLGKS